MKILNYRFLILLSAILLLSTLSTFGQATADPTSLPVYVASGPITVDGNLDEPDWSADLPHLMFNIGGTPSGNSYTPTSFEIVKAPYNDASTCYVRFLVSGTNLYISLNSDDQQVCRFGDSWEGDGIFMKIKDATNADVEFKLYYNLGGADPGIHFEGDANSEGAGVKGSSTVVNDSSNVDNGYTAELRIDLVNSLGYASVPSSIDVLINIFDPDNYTDGVTAWGPNGNFGKQWWGSQWGPDERTLNLLTDVVPVELTSFSASIIGNQVELNWETATETNNRGFEIQRKENSQNFHTIGFVDGKGTTTEKTAYSFIDKNTATGTSYSYRLKQVDFDGSFEYSNIINVDAIAPVEFSLGQNYPNPFNPATTISFNLPAKSEVILSIYNLLGQKVLTAANGQFEAGTHKVNIDASQLTSGMYIYNLKAVSENGNEFVSSKKMTLIK